MPPWGDRQVKLGVLRGLPTGIVIGSVLMTTAATADTEVCASSYERAQELRRGASLLEARTMLNACIASCPAVLAKDCSAWLVDVQSSVPSLQVDVRDDRGNTFPNAEVWVDDRAITPLGQPVDVDPGAHVVRAKRADGAAGQVTVAVQEREKNRVVMVVVRPIDPPVHAPIEPAPPPSTPRSTPAIVYVLAATGVAALGTGSYLGLSARAQADHLRETCKPHCADSQVDSVSRRLLIGDLFLGAGVVTLGVASWLWIRNGSTPSALGRFDLHPSSAGASLSVRGEF